MFDEVITTLIGRLPDHREASADGWAVVRLPEPVYPGLVRSPGSSARGRVYSGLTAEEWHLLDAFEDDEYQLSPITLVAAHVESLTYAWPHPLLEVPWEPSDFRTWQLSAYLERCARWRLSFDGQ